MEKGWAGFQGGWKRKREELYGWGHRDWLKQIRDWQGGSVAGTEEWTGEWWRLTLGKETGARLWSYPSILENRTAGLQPYFPYSGKNSISPKTFRRQRQSHMKSLMPNLLLKCIPRHLAKTCGPPSEVGALGLAWRRSTSSGKGTHEVSQYVISKAEQQAKGPGSAVLPFGHQFSHLRKAMALVVTCCSSLTL